MKKLVVAVISLLAFVASAGGQQTSSNKKGTVVFSESEYTVDEAGHKAFSQLFFEDAGKLKLAQTLFWNQAGKKGGGLFVGAKFDFKRFSLRVYGGFRTD